MSIANPPASLTVDELEAKLYALHDYLSTPYRSRAESILQQRRRREHALADSAASAPLQITATTAAAKEKESSTQASHAGLLMFPEEDFRNTHDATVEPHLQTSVAHTVDSPEISFLPDGGSHAEQQPSHWITPAPITPFGDRPTRNDGRLHANEAATATVAQDGSKDALAMQRRAERLEWQVQMLADALRHERDRFTELQEQVVLPLQGMVEASLRRQVELEWELSQRQGPPQQQ
ncbi:hypothetical protein ABB37_07132 [Leptomonas pyrrhocoris]|uniref:Uncharacterized protein n=1 Tax=Leptomonas pyrrhocoris TaxID=157538 RepID=A0A0M9FW11_LEPPY|nr:hypothetical protein ABB37_07132 [Leptomonas pyrrhocoris]KPA77225.1 hypothetical protein ABB37_07132 [Leptomonas pyrrhocoris]|eukprot:XP_015655664.1 hypothetical protein ABB37_07132 [Leptomonas pyrrhocoris]